MANKKKIHFEISERKILLRTVDIAVVLAVLYFVGIIFNFDYFKINQEHWVWSIVLAIYLTIFATIFELYNLQRTGKLEITIKNIILTSSVTVLFYLLTPFYTPILPTNRLQIVYFFLAISTALIFWRYVYIIFFASSRFYKRIMLVAKAKDVSTIIESLQKYDPNYSVVGIINTSSKLLDFEGNNSIVEVSIIDAVEAVKKLSISEIVVAMPDGSGMTADLSNSLIKLLEDGTPIREYTQVYEEITKRVPVQHVDRDFYRYFPFSRSNQNQLYLLIHRISDVLLSVFGIICGLIISPFILIGNVLGNRGPIFYSQKRVGKNGDVFKIWKLRTMVANAEEKGVQYAKLQDVRVTKFGRFLRKTRIDEIPQLYNVIIGNMSIIGPRPERPFFVEQLKEKIPFYEIRHLIKPGLTGWAQVNAKYGITEEDALEKLQYDLYYIKHRSHYLDISIIVKTLSTIIFYRGQ